MDPELAPTAKTPALLARLAALALLTGALGLQGRAASAQEGDSLPPTPVPPAAAPVASPASASAAGPTAPSPGSTEKGLAGSTMAPMTAPAAPSLPRPAVQGARPGGPTWSSLSAEQRAALRPLRAHWSGIDATRKQKWLEIAGRFKKLRPEEQARLHDRMAQWASLSPEQRSKARLTFQEAQQLPSSVLQDRWAAYLALSEEERQQLTQQATQGPQEKVRRTTSPPSPSFSKSNIVPNPLHVVPLQPVAPTVLRAGPGVSTTPLLRQPAQSPWHLQTGLPKIAATPEFVDPKTLAPRVGPQALAVAGAPRP